MIVKKTVSKKKRVLIIICIIVLLITLFPLRFAADDGGTVGYYAIVYTIRNNNAIGCRDGYQKRFVGIQIEIFNIRVFDNTRVVIDRRCEHCAISFDTKIPPIIRVVFFRLRASL